MRSIPLYGKYAHLQVLVDDEDYDRVIQYRWLHHGIKHLVYARRVIRTDGQAKRQFLHNFVTGWPRVDHINHDGLDNRRSNLRPADQRQNSQNARKSPTYAGRAPSSRFKGVSHRGSGWYAYIRANDRQIHLGVFPTEVEAAMAYDRAAVDYFGAWAALNFSEHQSVNTVSTSVDQIERLSR